MPSVTLSELRKNFEQSSSDNVPEELEESMLNASVSNNLIRGTSKPTSISNGAWLRLYDRSTGSTSDAPKMGKSNGMPFEDFSGKMRPFTVSVKEKATQIAGRFIGYNSGHAMTNQLLRELFANPNAWQMMQMSAKLSDHLHGVAEPDAIPDFKFLA